MHLAGHAAIVTGGASGLGAATAAALVKAGAKVTLLDLNEATLAAQTAALGCHAEVCNVADEASTARAIESAEQRHGVARVIVNCAGIGKPGKAVGRDGPMPLGEFVRIVNVNLVGTFNVIRLAAARLQDAAALDGGERGVIVNTASIAAFDGQIGQPAYSASKAGVVGMTLPLAREFARVGIRVVTIAPGVFETPMLGGELNSQMQGALTASIPFPPRLGRPSEFAQLVISIAENSFLNGETIRLDGAQRMPPK
jgi:NAD(P)-dependent dehydrogenase (short-subunit alcohol dehydrogenase family)